MVMKTRNNLIALIIAALAIAGAGTLIYANTFDGPFLFDDMPNITDNPNIRMTTISLSEIAKAVKSPSGYRPVPNISFALHYFVHQYDTFGYHLVNLMVHLLTALLVFLVGRQTLHRLNRDDSATPPADLTGLTNLAALAAALLWLANPVHTQSVTYIVQRMNAMAAMFYMLSLFFYIKARMIQLNDKPESSMPLFLFGASFAAGICALGSKQIAATLPVFILLYEWYFFRNLNAAWLKHQIKWLVALAFVFSAIALVYLGKSPLDRMLDMYDTQDFTLGQRLLTEPRVVLYYLTLLFFPHPDRLMLDYEFPASTALMTPVTTLPAMGTLVALTVMAVFTAKKHRLLSFAIFWYLGNLAIESSFIGLALVFEHRTYLPSIFLFIAFVAFIRQRIPIRAITVPSLCLLIAVSAFWTHQRNKTWQDAISFWLDCTQKIPHTDRAYNNLGIAYLENGMTDKALAAFQTCIQNGPSFENAYNNIGIILRDDGNPQQSVPYFQKALEINPGYPDAHYNLGLALFDMALFEQAEAAFQNAIKADPLHAKAHNNLGIIRQQQGKTDQAIALFHKALEFHPYFEKAYNNLGIAWYRKGNTDRAMQYFQKAMMVNPAYADAGDNLAIIQKNMARYGALITKLTTALEQSPEDGAISLQLGKVYEEAGMTDKAIAQYRQALASHPDFAAGHHALFNVYVNTNQFNNAIAPLTELARLLPENPVIFYNLACLYAKQNKKEQAILHLKTAVEKGYSKWDTLATDKDLENIRNTEYYQELMKEVH